MREDTENHKPVFHNVHATADALIGVCYDLSIDNDVVAVVNEKDEVKRRWDAHVASLLNVDKEMENSNKTLAQVREVMEPMQQVMSEAEDILATEPAKGFNLGEAKQELVRVTVRTSDDSLLGRDQMRTRTEIWEYDFRKYDFYDFRFSDDSLLGRDRTRTKVDECWALVVSHPTPRKYEFFFRAVSSILGQRLLHKMTNSRAKAQAKRMQHFACSIVGSCCNMSSRAGQTNATCCVQLCCTMLYQHVASVWQGFSP